MSDATSQGVSRPVHPWVAEGERVVRFGVAYGPTMTSQLDWPALLDFVLGCEEAGIDSFWVPDHPTSFPDPWVTLAGLAATTRRIRLGPMVSCVYYRNPVQLARLAADVDRMSNGRLILGLGIGDSTTEFAQLGLPCPPVAVRQRALDEAVQIIQGLWATDSFTFHGEHFHVDEASIATQPVQEPYVPILIAGGGERVTLRQVAKRAEMANFGAHPAVGSAFDLDDVRRKFAALDRHLAEARRPTSAVLRSHWSAPVVVAETTAAARAKWEVLPEWVRSNFQSSAVVGTPAEVIAYYQPLVRAGMRYFITVVIGADIESVRLLAARVAPGLGTG
jgi:alkanesulfonate monooxygenase SsuD/methylene tetrahydromethanopterin reductase-like flavin-dependent oxidoreductase (luciferase family)